MMVTLPHGACIPSIWAHNPFVNTAPSEDAATWKAAHWPESDRTLMQMGVTSTFFPHPTCLGWPMTTRYRCHEKQDKTESMAVDLTELK